MGLVWRPSVEDVVNGFTLSDLGAPHPFWRGFRRVLVVESQQVVPGTPRCPAWDRVGSRGLVYLRDNDGGPEGHGADRFAHEPAYGCFAVQSSSGARTWDFILAADHATWSGGDADATSAEVRNIGVAFNAMSALRAGKRDFLIAGDFNLLPSDLRNAVQATDATVGLGSTRNIDGKRTANLSTITCW